MFRGREREQAAGRGRRVAPVRWWTGDFLTLVKVCLIKSVIEMLRGTGTGTGKKKTKEKERKEKPLDQIKYLPGRTAQSSRRSRAGRGCYRPAFNR